jgi:putative ABC transport system permease protein
MSVSELWRRVAELIHRDRAAQDLEEEMRLHVELRAAANRRAGMGGAAAASAARKKFGNRAMLQIESRDAWGFVRLEAFLDDARYALRSLARSPVFTASVVLTLALGIGANTALFTILDRFFLQQPGGLNDAHQTRRVVIHIADQQHSARNAATTFNYPEYRTIADAMPAGFRSAAYFTQSDVRLGADRRASQGVVSYVVDDYFGVLGVRPAMGRVLQAEECSTRVLSPVAVLSYAFWRSHFALAPDIIGQQIEVASHRYTVVGVAGEDFTGIDLSAVDIWVPRNTLGSWDDWTPTRAESPKMVILQSLVRPPVSPESNAQGEGLATVALRHGGWTADSTATATFESLRTAVNLGAQGTEARMSLRLAGVALFILLIACANVANLLLVRTMQRQREIATRIALGVSRARLISQALTESAILAAIGGVAALVCSAWSTPILWRALLPQVQSKVAGFGPSTFVYAALLVVLTGLATGIVPALHAGRADLYRSLHGNPGGPASYRSGIRPVLLAAQVSLAVVLLAAAALLVRSFRNVEAIDTGYDAERLAYAEVQPDMTFGKRDAEAYRAIGAMLPDVAQRLARVPGVEGTALALRRPLQPPGFWPVFLPGRDSTPKMNRGLPFTHVVSQGFFTVSGMHMQDGRALREADGTGAEPVVVVNTSMAKTFWPGERAVGKCIIVGKRESACRTVVGVVADAHYLGIFEQPAMQLYLPFAQADSASLTGIPYPGSILIRFRAGSPASSAAGVKDVFISMTKALGTPTIKTMAEALAPIQHPWQLAADLFAGAALLGLLVAAIGIYGTIAYTVSLQRHEIGVRIALGAQHGEIMRSVVQSGLRVVGIGVVAGLALVLALGKLIESMLYGTTSHDTATLIVVPVTLVAVGIAACAIPAWRSGKVDPVMLLRSE